MPRSSCEPCCQPQQFATSQDSYRAAVLQILCAIVANSESLPTDLDEIIALLTTVAGWDESARAKVNPIVGQAGVQGNSGTVSANTQRVVLATDVALPAGTNLLGKTGVDQTSLGVTNGVSVVANNGGTPVDCGVYNATQSVIGVGIGAYPSGANAVQIQGEIAHDSADAGLPQKIGGKASTTAPAPVAANDRVNAWFDLNGRMSQFLSYLYSRISSNTTTTIKSGAGILHTITISKKGASSNTITVYDNTAGSGTVIALIDSTASVVTLTFDVAFATGLTIVTATGTAPDITVSYL